MSNDSIHELAARLYDAQISLDLVIRAAKWKLHGAGMGKEDSIIAAMQLVEEGGQKIHEFLRGGEVDYSKIPAEERDPYKQHRTLARELGRAVLANYDSLQITDQYITLSETQDLNLDFQSESLKKVKLIPEWKSTSIKTETSCLEN